MIRAIHVEDEPGNIAVVRNLVSKHCASSVDLIGSATNLPEAYDLIKTEKPQLVYLDIEINQGNAFELLDKLNETIGINFEIIFITAFNDYAIKAFRQNAVDYILKPISTAELTHATLKAVEKINSAKQTQNILALLNEIKQNTNTSKIGLPVVDGLEFVHDEDIISIEAKGSYAVVHLVGGSKLTCSKTLKDIETLLPVTKFLRVHNTWIINNSHLKKYYRGKNSYMEMDDNSTVPVSVRRKGDFLDKL